MKRFLWTLAFATVGILGYAIGNHIGQSKVYDQYGSALVKCVESTENGVDWSVYAVCLNDNFFAGSK